MPNLEILSEAMPVFYDLRREHLSVFLKELKDKSAFLGFYCLGLLGYLIWMNLLELVIKVIWLDYVRDYAL